MAERTTSSATRHGAGVHDLLTSEAAVERPNPEEQWLRLSIAKWLGATGQAQSVIAEARARADRDIAALQVSIMLAQDNLAADNRVGQQALLRKIDCAEELNQTARRFDRLSLDMGCLAAIARRLANVLTALSRKNPDAFFLAALPGTRSIPPIGDRASMERQLANIKIRVDQLAQATEEMPLDELWHCVLSLRPVVTFLSQQTIHSMVELRVLGAVLEEIDREILLSRST